MDFLDTALDRTLVGYSRVGYALRRAATSSCAAGEPAEASRAGGGGEQGRFRG